jgi:hypothetical protein
LSDLLDLDPFSEKIPNTDEYHDNIKTISELVNSSNVPVSSISRSNVQTALDLGVQFQLIIPKVLPEFKPALVRPEPIPVEKPASPREKTIYGPAQVMKKMPPLEKPLKKNPPKTKPKPRMTMAVDIPPSASLFPIPFSMFLIYLDFYRGKTGQEYG